MRHATMQGRDGEGSVAKSREEARVTATTTRINDQRRHSLLVVVGVVQGRQGWQKGCGKERRDGDAIGIGMLSGSDGDARIRIQG